MFIIAIIPAIGERSRIKRHIYNKRSFIKTLDEMHEFGNKVSPLFVLEKLKDRFTYGDLKKAAEDTRKASLTWIPISRPFWLPAFQWLDYILKDGKKPDILKDKVNYEVMGANKWKHVGSLDKMNNDTLKFYLNNYLLDTSICSK